MTESQFKQMFQHIEDNFNAVVISNSVDKLKKCITKDWNIADAQGGILSQERIFYVIEQGLLSHSTMTKEVLRVNIYGDFAVVTGRGQNTGTWQGQPSTADEWVTDVYKKENDKWLLCLDTLDTSKK